MPFPKLSPLQSRLAASLMASLALLILWLTFSSSQFAYAAELESKLNEDHNHKRLGGGPFLDIDVEEVDLGEADYEADFLGYDRGIIGRATTSTEPTALINNRMVLTNVVQGTTLSYSFLSASLYGSKSLANGVESAFQLLGRKPEAEHDVEVENYESEEEQLTQELRLRTRQNASQNVTLHISVNVCSQPSPIALETVAPPPQLQLYISQSASNMNPGPGQDASSQEVMVLKGGAAMFSLNATGDVFIGLYGENTTEYQGVWNAQIAASIDAPYHYYHNTPDPNLYLVDSDSGSALLITRSLNSSEPADPEEYEEWLRSPPPYVMFASNQDDSQMAGIQSSYCGLETYAAMKPENVGRSADTIQTGMTSRGVDNGPKQQFHVRGLTPGSAYKMFLAVNGNSTAAGDGVVGGGGQVFPVSSFQTLSGSTCGVIFNLSFCDQTAYAVPSNPNTFPDVSALSSFYDDQARAQYQFFQNALQQIPCETTSSAQYTLTRTCTDCAVAYKAWLCSVLIPRCTDFSSDLPWLQARAMGQPFPNGTMLDAGLVRFANQSGFLNSSRNPAIDSIVRPGPYKEILPCDDLCYNVVKSCPASLGFNCPLPGNVGFNQSYGRRPIEGPTDGRITDLTCNYPGAAYFLAGSGRSSPRLGMVGLAALGVAAWMVL